MEVDPDALLHQTAQLHALNSAMRRNRPPQKPTVLIAAKEVDKCNFGTIRTPSGTIEVTERTLLKSLTIQAVQTSTMSRFQEAVDDLIELQQKPAKTPCGKWRHRELYSAVCNKYRKDAKNPMHRPTTGRMLEFRLFALAMLMKQVYGNVRTTDWLCEFTTNDSPVAMSTLQMLSAWIVLLTQTPFVYAKLLEAGEKTNQTNFQQDLIEHIAKSPDIIAKCLGRTSFRLTSAGILFLHVDTEEGKDPAAWLKWVLKTIGYPMDDDFDSLEVTAFLTVTMLQLHTGGNAGVVGAATALSTKCIQYIQENQEAIVALFEAEYQHGVDGAAVVCEQIAGEHMQNPNIAQPVNFTPQTLGTDFPFPIQNIQHAGVPVQQQVHVQNVGSPCIPDALDWLDDPDPDVAKLEKDNEELLREVATLKEQLETLNGLNQFQNDATAKELIAARGLLVQLRKQLKLAQERIRGDLFPDEGQLTKERVEPQLQQKLSRLEQQLQTQTKLSEEQATRCSRLAADLEEARESQQRMDHDHQQVQRRLREETQHRQDAELHRKEANDGMREAVLRRKALEAETVQLEANIEDLKTQLNAVKHKFVVQLKNTKILEQKLEHLKQKDDDAVAALHDGECQKLAKEEHIRVLADLEAAKTEHARVTHLLQAQLDDKEADNDELRKRLNAIPPRSPNLPSVDDFEVKQDDQNEKVYTPAGPDDQPFDQSPGNPATARSDDSSEQLPTASDDKIGGEDPSIPMKPNVIHPDETTNPPIKLVGSNEWRQQLGVQLATKTPELRNAFADALQKCVSCTETKCGVFPFSFLFEKGEINCEDKLLSWHRNQKKRKMRNSDDESDDESGDGSDDESDESGDESDDESDESGDESDDELSDEPGNKLEDERSDDQVMLQPADAHEESSDESVVTASDDEQPDDEVMPQAGDQEMLQPPEDRFTEFLEKHFETWPEDRAIYSWAEENMNAVKPQQRNAGKNNWHWGFAVKGMARIASWPALRSYYVRQMSKPPAGHGPENELPVQSPDCPVNADEPAAQQDNPPSKRPRRAAAPTRSLDENLLFPDLGKPQSDTGKWEIGDDAKEVIRELMPENGFDWREKKRPGSGERGSEPSVIMTWRLSDDDKRFGYKRAASGIPDYRLCLHWLREYASEEHKEKLTTALGRKMEEY